MNILERARQYITGVQEDEEEEEFTFEEKMESWQVTAEMLFKDYSELKPRSLRAATDRAGGDDP